MSKCDTCKYRESETFPWKCNYISIVGHSRPCDCGNACTVYEEGNRIIADRLSAYDVYAYKGNYK